MNKRYVIIFSLDGREEVIHKFYSFDEAIELIKLSIATIQAWLPPKWSDGSVHTIIEVE